jgi:carbon storage regulator
MEALMLVLSRRSNQSVIVGSEDLQRMLTVTVLQINGQNVRLGFDAPHGVAVHRSEVWAQISAAALAPAARALVKKGTGHGNA